MSPLIIGLNLSTITLEINLSTTVQGYKAKALDISGPINFMEEEECDQFLLHHSEEAKDCGCNILPDNIPMIFEKVQQRSHPARALCRQKEDAA